MLERMWGSVRADLVFRTDMLSLGGITVSWMRDLYLGGLLGRTSPKSLLDTSPLRGWLGAHIPIDRVGANVDSGALTALAVTATDLHSADGVVFVQSRLDLPLWQRTRWRIEASVIGIEHLMASSAIPVFFPSVEVGGRHFGDGSIRNTAPLSPAIQLGADRIVAVGVRQSRPRDLAAIPRGSPPTIAHVAAAVFDAVMLDAFEADVAHSERISDCVSRRVVAAPNGVGLRSIKVLWITPSRPIRPIAAEHLGGIPPLVRYLLRGLGDQNAVVELASYLLFDAAFCRRLIDLGRRDVLARSEEVRRFFTDP